MSEYVRQHTANAPQRGCMCVRALICTERACGSLLRAMDRCWRYSTTATTTCDHVVCDDCVTTPHTHTHIHQMPHYILDAHVLPCVRGATAFWRRMCACNIHIPPTCYTYLGERLQMFAMPSHARVDAVNYLLPNAEAYYVFFVYCHYLTCIYLCMCAVA